MDVLLFGRRPNRGHLDQITRTVDVESPCLTDLVASGVRHIGAEYLIDLVFEVKSNKEVQNKQG